MAKARLRLTDHLWVVGLVASFLITWIAALLIPAGTGPYSERPFAKALLLGGALGVSFLVVDVARHPRRLWVWGLAGWGVMVCFSAWSGAFGKDSDIDQILSWGFLLGGLVGLPLIIGSSIVWIWKRAAHAIGGRPRRWRAEVHDNSLEITRRG